jgi:23S rRNA (cytidine1920-2'-O)/16S rRNA (cytidine1409-2'-O)-methyltransferase
VAPNRHFQFHLQRRKQKERRTIHVGQYIVSIRFPPLIKTSFEVIPSAFAHGHIKRPEESDLPPVVFWIDELFQMAKIVQRKTEPIGMPWISMCKRLLIRQKRHETLPLGLYFQHLPRAGNVPDQVHGPQATVPCTNGLRGRFIDAKQPTSADDVNGCIGFRPHFKGHFARPLVPSGAGLALHGSQNKRGHLAGGICVGGWHGAGRYCIAGLLGRGSHKGLGTAIVAPAVMSKTPRVRADTALVDQGLAMDLPKARALILAGEVLWGDTPVQKAGDWLPQHASLRLRNEPMPFVSRGGVKLAHALDTFGVDVAGKVALDVGASTGGFTDCLLQRNVARVYCIDVGHGQLAHKVATDPRVVVVDKTNVRHMASDRIPERGTLCVIDVSFISLRLVLPALPGLLEPGSSVVALVKPQFEVERHQVGEKGIVRDEAARAAAVANVIACARELGFSVLAETVSPITGGKGNIEFLIHAQLPLLRHSKS